MTDNYEGLIVVDVETLTDGDPDNNFFERGTTFNPEGLLNGAINITIGGNYAYISCDRDRAVDESGNQVSVFGRLGSRPSNLEEQRLYVRDGKIFTVTNDPPSPPLPYAPLLASP